MREIPTVASAPAGKQARAAASGLAGEAHGPGDAGAITPAQIDRVQSTWALVYPHKRTAAVLFYGKLFELEPSLRRLFRCEMFEQGDRLMTMIDRAVQGLTQVESLLPAVRELGVRHQGYGANPEHYQAVAQALLWTVEQALGDAFTDDIRDAWTSLYALLARTMIPG